MTARVIVLAGPCSVVADAVAKGCETASPKEAERRIRSLTPIA